MGSDGDHPPPIRIPFLGTFAGLTLTHVWFMSSNGPHFHSTITFLSRPQLVFKTHESSFHYNLPHSRPCEKYSNDRHVACQLTRYMMTNKQMYNLQICDKYIDQWIDSQIDDRYDIEFCRRFFLGFYLLYVSIFTIYFSNYMTIQLPSEPSPREDTMCSLL